MLALLWKMSPFFTRSHGSHATAAQRQRPCFWFVFNYAFHLSASFAWVWQKRGLRCSGENPRLLESNDLPGSNQTENRPLLRFCSTLKLHQATYPHWNPHAAVQDVYLHFRANEWLLCEVCCPWHRHTNIYIWGQFHIAVPRFVRLAWEDAQFRSNNPVKIIKS